MASVQLIIPKRFASRFKRTRKVDEQKPIVSASEYYQEKQRQRAAVKRREHPGRNMGKPHGTWVTDMGARHQSILLCQLCRHKFDPARYHYYKTREFKVQGRCDACKEHENNATFFIHESLLGRNHGQCWTPR
jgi:hypothetical protein